MVSVRSVIVLSLGALLGACSDGASRVLGPATMSASSAPSLSRDRDEKQSVTGAAEYIEPQIQQTEAYSMSAIRHTNGSVSGEVELFLAQNGGIRIHGEVVCFAVLGNRANLAMRVTRTNTPDAPEGSYLIWSVADNDQNGPHRVPDQSSGFETADGSRAAEHCASGVGVGALAPIHGNLEVRN